MMILMMMIVMIVMIMMMDSDQVVGEELNHMEEAEDHPVSQPSEIILIVNIIEILVIENLS